MSAMSTEPASVLRPGMLNVVGEFHSESGPRRALEKQFVIEKLGSGSGYWTEQGLKDEPIDLGSNRKKKGGEGYATKGADLMELRAAHGVAMLITSYEGLCKEAERVSAIADDSAGAAVVAFLKTNMKTFIAVQKKVERTWEPTGSADVNKAVQDVYDKITQIRQRYLEVLGRAREKAAKGEIDKAKEVQTYLAATRAVGKSRDDVNKLLPSLLTTVGVDSSVNAAKLAELMRDLRSSFMGLAGGYQSQVGVWKIGQGHIDDLKRGDVSVDMSKANYVTREDFNKEFDAWNDLRLAKLKK